MIECKKNTAVKSGGASSAIGPPNILQNLSVNLLELRFSLLNPVDFTLCL